MTFFGWTPKPHYQRQRCCEAAPSRCKRSEHLEARHWLSYPTSRIGSLASKLAVVVAVVCSLGHEHVRTERTHYQWQKNHLAVDVLGICATGVHLTGMHCYASLDRICLWGSSCGNSPFDRDHLLPPAKACGGRKEAYEGFPPLAPFPSLQ